MNAIEIKSVTKKYGSLLALDNITLAFEQNKIYGLLGRNGAGKTTLLNLMTNKLFPSQGSITVDGQTVTENDEALSKMFYMTEMSLIPDRMRFKKALEWTKAFYPSFETEYANELCAKFELDPNKKVKQLSTGYNSIAKLILTLASGAPILIFDEPVLGLDAHHRDLFYKELLARYNESPCTVILSTHLIDEVADVVEQAVILSDGRVTLNQTVEELLRSAHTVSGEADQVDAYTRCKKVVHEQVMSKFKAATVFGGERDAALAERLGVELSGVNLQQLFIHLTNS